MLSHRFLPSLVLAVFITAVLFVSYLILTRGGLDKLW